jgi:hypothetical protein
MDKWSTFLIVLRSEGAPPHRAQRYSGANTSGHHALFSATRAAVAPKDRRGMVAECAGSVVALATGWWLGCRRRAALIWRRNYAVARSLPFPSGLTG